MFESCDPRLRIDDTSSSCARLRLFAYAKPGKYDDDAVTVVPFNDDDEDERSDAIDGDVLPRMPENGLESTASAASTSKLPRKNPSAMNASRSGSSKWQNDDRMHRSTHSL